MVMEWKEIMEENQNILLNRSNPIPKVCQQKHPHHSHPHTHKNLRKNYKIKSTRKYNRVGYTVIAPSNNHHILKHQQQTTVLHTVVFRPSVHWYRNAVLDAHASKHSHLVLSALFTHSARVPDEGSIRTGHVHYESECVCEGQNELRVGEKSKKGCVWRNTRIEIK